MRLIIGLRFRPFSALSATALILGTFFVLQITPLSHALTVSPVRLEIAVDPGETYQGEMILKNEQDRERTFYGSSENFEARGETGAPYFVPGREGLVGWIGGMPEFVTLDPGERRVIPFTITVPADAKPGGYFAALLWNDTPPSPSAGGQVAIGAKVGSLVLLRVAGDIEEGGGIIEFTTADGRSVFTSLPVAFAWRIQNTGGDRIQPEGSLRISNMLGMLSAALPANPPKGNVLPGSTRKFEATWTENATGSGSTAGAGFFSAAREQARHWRMGRYVAALDLVPTLGAPPSVSFYVLPWQLLTLLFVVLVLLSLLTRLFLSRYKRRILAHANAPNPSEDQSAEARSSSR